MAPGAGSILAGYQFLAWLFPATPLGDVTSQSYEELCEKYRRRDFWGNWLGFLCFLAAIPPFYFFLAALSDAVVSDLSEQWLFRPHKITLGFAAIFLSLFCSSSVLLLAYRLALGIEEYEIYMAYGGEKFRRSGLGVALHAGKVFLFIFLALGLPLWVFTLAYIDSYSAFEDQRIVIDPFWSVHQRVIHDYADVAGVYEVENELRRGELEFKPYQVILFKDGSRWESDRGALDPKLQRQRDLVMFVSKKSGQPLQIVESEEKLPQQ